MTGAITSRPAGAVEAEDFVTYDPEDGVHHGSVKASQIVLGGKQQIVLDCQDCHTDHVWEISRTQLITVQRTPR